MVQTTQKNIRVTPEQWKRVEKEAHSAGCFCRTSSWSSSRWKALERREWPRTEAEIHLLRSAMFAAQAIIRDMERAGRVGRDRANQQEYLRSRARIAIETSETGPG